VNAVNPLLTARQRSSGYNRLESEDVVEVSEEDLAAFNSLVQDGLIEVVSIDEDGMPYYRIATEFAGPLEATGPGC
jgi:hypothetical protein